MSVATFQTEIARLITSPQFRKAVQENGINALSADLSPLEQKRLLSVAGSKGLKVTWLLHKGFRLNKLLSRVPLTMALLGDDKMAQEIKLFWEQTPPTSFYFIAEAIEFCDFLLDRYSILAICHLEEIVSFERAKLVLQLPRTSQFSSPQTQVVRFSCDPIELLAALENGDPLDDLEIQPFLLIGQLDETGEIVWSRAEGSLSE